MPEDRWDKVGHLLEGARNCPLSGGSLFSGNNTGTRRLDRKFSRSSRRKNRRASSEPVWRDVYCLRLRGARALKLLHSPVPTAVGIQGSLGRSTALRPLCLSDASARKTGSQRLRGGGASGLSGIESRSRDGDRYSSALDLRALQETNTPSSGDSSTASHLTIEGAPKEVVAEVLGPPTTGMADKYSHLSPRAAERAMQQTFRSGKAMGERSPIIPPLHPIFPGFWGSDTVSQPSTDRGFTPARTPVRAVLLQVASGTCKGSGDFCATKHGRRVWHPGA